VFIMHCTMLSDTVSIFPKAAPQMVAFQVFTSQIMSFPTFRRN